MARWVKKFSGLFALSGPKALLFFGLVFSLPAPASAELIHGFAAQTEGAFDFEQQRTVHWTDPSADLSIWYTSEGHRALGSHGAELVMMSGMSWEEVRVAPADTSLYLWDIPLYQDSTYVIRTGEGNYAKFRVIPPYWGYFEYVYQSDGSRVLDETVPIQVTTWGRIKELFLERR